MDDLILSTIKLNDLEILIENSIRKVLKASEATSKLDHTSETDFLDVQQASVFLKLAVPTIYSMASRRQLVSYKRGKKLYFKKSELLQFIQTGRRSNMSEIREKARHYKP